MTWRAISARPYASGVRIICSHQAGKAARSTVIQTQGNAGVKQNIATVFGAKTTAAMMPVGRGGHSSPRH